MSQMGYGIPSPNEEADGSGPAVAIVGSVEVSNDAGNPLPVSGTVSIVEPVTVDGFPADYPSVAVLAKVEEVRALLAAALTVLGPLTNAELRAADVKVSLDGEPVALDAAALSALAALETISVTNFPADYPSTALLAKVEQVRVLLAAALAVTGPLTNAELRAAAVVVDVLISTSTLGNGAETAVADTAVLVLAANAGRKGALIQNTGLANVRIGATGVSNVTGFRLVPGGHLTFSLPDIPTGAVYAIREGATSSEVFTQEMT